LISFYTKDGSVFYDDQDRKLTLKGKNKFYELDSLSIQLTPEDFVFVSRGTTQTLKKSRRISSDSFALGLPFINFDITYEHTGGYIDRLWVTVGSKTAFIAPHDDSKGYNWNIAIQTDSNKNDVVLAQSAGKNHYLEFHDYLNKVGILLWSDKDNGIFNSIVGQRVVYKDYFSTDYNSRLHYSQKGILKRNKWNEPVRCD
jgi:hypothetical protein